MQIHVVRPGDTLFNIARAYSVNLNKLITANEIANPDTLVVGQALVVPIWGSYYWVKPGDSLYKISRKVGIPVKEIAEINGIKRPRKLPVGLRLYIPPKPKIDKEVSAYIDPKFTAENTANEVIKVGDHLTYLTVFSYAINRDGTLTAVNDEPAINAAYSKNVVPLMVITNFEEGTFSNELATKFFNDENMQNAILDLAIKIMEEKGYLGLDFDLEYLGAENREKYNEFLKKASAKLKEKNYYLSTALAPKITGDQKGTLYEGHDYQAQGEIVDFIFFMTYEWGWSGGPPLAVSPITEVKKVMDYAISVVPKEKIMMGIPLYGYDWTLPYVKGGQWAKSLSPQQAIETAAKYNARIEYDRTSQAPYFNYYDENGKKHIVWFEDARSIQAKFNLVKELGIRGFFYWVLGYDFPQNWLLIEDNFNVKKKV
ncbi:glycoside hydrolase family 18 protein [Clostridium sp. 'deep sea']|uniref:glycoside hydrolase family 18 protein n=1 Tax=Clostridium sp. 'deep sea' TaxID=2779445 RepID=UPI0018969B57|nr:glycoside hydrolase family 18 protein [Clostridium sp. 'deep sea']QOR35439.1 glycoside hydrolase family 18 protein [Clostridium sp. 'deep sea']